MENELSNETGYSESWKANKATEVELPSLSGCYNYKYAKSP